MNITGDLPVCFGMIHRPPEQPEPCQFSVGQSGYRVSLSCLVRPYDVIASEGKVFDQDKYIGFVLNADEAEHLAKLLLSTVRNIRSEQT